MLGVSLELSNGLTISPEIYSFFYQRTLFSGLLFLCRALGNILGRLRNGSLKGFAEEAQRVRGRAVKEIEATVTERLFFFFCIMSGLQVRVTSLALQRWSAARAQNPTGACGSLLYSDPA